MRFPGDNWPKERDDRLRKLYADGLSFGQIAVHLNCGLSRNAVVGRAGRLGLTGRGDALRAKAVERKAAGNLAGGIVAGLKARRRSRTQSAETKAAVRNINRNGHAASAPPDDEPAFARAPLPDESADLKIDKGQRKTLFELTAETCRWPVGVPGHESFFFCGAIDADMSAGRPYCHQHAKRAGAG